MGAYPLYARKTQIWAYQNLPLIDLILQNLLKMQFALLENQ